MGKATFPCLVDLEAVLNFSDIFNKVGAHSNILASREAGRSSGQLLTLCISASESASQEDKHRDKTKKNKINF